MFLTHHFCVNGLYASPDKDTEMTVRGKSFMSIDSKKFQSNGTPGCLFRCDLPLLCARSLCIWLIWRALRFARGAYFEFWHESVGRSLLCRRRASKCLLQFWNARDICCKVEELTQPGLCDAKVQVGIALVAAGFIQDGVPQLIRHPRHSTACA